jgi:hypothetical protein
MGRASRGSLPEVARAQQRAVVVFLLLAPARGAWLRLLRRLFTQLY